MNEEPNINIVQLSLSIARKEQINNIPTEELEKLPSISHICRCLLVNIMTDFGYSFADIDIDNLENSARYLTKIVVQGEIKTPNELSFLRSKNFLYGVPENFDQRCFSDSILFCSDGYNLAKNEKGDTFLFGHTIDGYSKDIHLQLITIINEIIQSAL